MLSILVQNYFERNGVFDGIENTVVYSALLNTMNETGESKEEVCYRLLGYDGAESSVNLMKLRQALMKGEDYKSLVSSVTGEELKKLNVLTSCVDYLGENAISKVKNDGIVKLLAAYYKNDVYNLVSDDDGELPFGIWLKQKNKMSVNQLLNNEKVQEHLAEFVYAEDEELPTVVGGKLYSKFDFTKKEQNEFHKEALKRVMYTGTPMQKWGRIPVNELMILSTVNKKVYLQMIDYAIATGHTYAEMLRELGIQIPDLILAYETTGYPFFTLNNRVMYYCGNGNWDTIPLAMFETLLNVPDVDSILPVYKERNVKYPFVKRTEDATNELHCF